MKVISILSLIFPLLYIGCGELEKINSDINVSNITETKELLSELGLDIKNQRISLDFNKTTNFFKKMEIEMHGKADEIQHKIQRADINFTRDIGIDFRGEILEIDLNKTKKMFQEINILMKEVLLDKNSSKS